MSRKKLKVKEGGPIEVSYRKIFFSKNVKNVRNYETKYCFRGEIEKNLLGVFWPTYIKSCIKDQKTPKNGQKAPKQNFFLKTVLFLLFRTFFKSVEKF